MTWVKICGITNLEDALMAVDAGADALGFVFYEKSPRKVEAETAQEIVAALPEKIEKVGVFVDESSKRVCELVAQIGLTVVQIYKSETVSGFLEQPGEPPKTILVIPGDRLEDGGFFIGTELKVGSKPKLSLHALMIDSTSATQPGGTGRRFNWLRARGMILHLGRRYPTIIAGGLTDANVGEAIKLLRPWGVDVSSGVEASPGKKDPEKVRTFVAAVRAAEKTL